jgi:hypothetical protein
MPLPHSSFLRIPALGALALAAVAGNAGAQQQTVGVNSAVNPDVRGLPPGAPARQLVLGSDVVFKERITTSPQGQTQVLFLDKSALTMGPTRTLRSTVHFVSGGTGKLAIGAAQESCALSAANSANEMPVRLMAPTGAVAHAVDLSRRNR